MSGTTTTPNYGLLKPNVNGDDDQWGSHLNQDLDTLDALIHSIDVRPAGGVSSWNTRVGAVTMQGADVTTALGYTPYDAANPAGYQTAAQVATAIGTPVASFNTRTGAVVLSSADVTTALTFTPYNATNPAGYQTAAQVTSALTPYAPLNSPVFTGSPSLPTGSVAITQAPGNATQALATTQFVTTALGSIQTGVTVSDTPPVANPGALWYDSANTGLYVRYNDGNSSQWVVANNQNVLPDAPNDGRLYGRQSAGWVQAAPTAVLGNVGRNLVMNPCFTVAQRGAGPFTGGFQYTLDRWAAARVNDTFSITQGPFIDAARASIGNEAAIYYLANAFTGNATVGSFCQLQQRMENVRALSGKTITVSFWAACNTGAMNLGLNFSQNFGTGGSPSTAIYALATGASFTLNTTYTRYSTTFAVPSAAGKTFGTTAGTDFSNLVFWYSAASDSAAISGNIGVQSGSISLWGIQLEIQQPGQTGPSALDYGGTPADQLRQCQRYYFVGAFNISAGASAAGIGWTSTYALPVTMRAVPTITPSGTTVTNVNSQAVNAMGAWGIQAYAVSAAAGGLTWAGTLTASADL